MRRERSNSMSLFLETILQGVMFSVIICGMAVVPGMIGLYLLWRFNRRAFWKLRF